MFRNTFPMRDNSIIPLSLGDQGKGVRPQFWYVLLVHRCTREWCNPFGRTRNYRDSRINQMFRNTFPMRDILIIPLSLRDQE